jgi:hypothetical protein
MDHNPRRPRGWRKEFEMFETTEELKWLIFDSEEERKAFVAQRIVAPARYCRSIDHETFIAVRDRVHPGR